KFNAPWAENVWVPQELTAQEVCAMPISGSLTSLGRDCSGCGHNLAAAASTDKEQYVRSLLRVIAALKERGVAKTVISIVRNRHLAEGGISELFANLANNSRGCFAYVCYTPESGLWMGAPPEVLIKTNEGGGFETMALAGTLPIDAAEWDDKNALEHQIVVDYIVDALSALGLRVEKGARAAMPYGSIKHLYTPMRGELGMRKASELYDALNPTPALCGYPKEDALADIALAEKHERGCYGGCVGLMSSGGAVEARVNIRCCRIDGRQAVCFGGGGITPDSIPETEWREANAKIDNLLSRLKHKK
ncbi:MAG: chorismate-binding protein, partial [Clostridium sp.]|nr:chorismate-binding protein [Clostridium sp.]